MRRLLLGDSIFFEDALGRTRRLPFEYFQHFDVSIGQWGCYIALADVA